MKNILRLSVLVAVIVLGYRLLFPQGIDIGEPTPEEQRQQSENAAYEREARFAALEASKPQAQILAGQLWDAVDAGDIDAIWNRAGDEFQQRNPKPQFAEQLRDVMTLFGPARTDAQLASEPGYADAAPRVSASPSQMYIEVRSTRWGERAVCHCTLRFTLEQDELRVHSLLVEPKIYHGREDLLSGDQTAPRIF